MIVIDELIKKFKARYARLYWVQIGHHQFIWRELTRKEYRRICETTKNEYSLEELVCNTAILHPKIDFKNYYAGIPGVLAPIIVETSGFIDQRQLIQTLETHRASMSSFENQAETYIKTVFPQYTFEEMENWTVDKLLNVLARAEWSLTNMSGTSGKHQAPVFEKQEEKLQTPAQVNEVFDDKEQFRKFTQSIREDGIDPMVLLASQIMQKEPYLIPPLIGGTSQWRNEVVLDVIREQISTVSTQRSI